MNQNGGHDLLPFKTFFLAFEIIHFIRFIILNVMIVGICMESLCNSRSVCPIDNVITCLRTLHSLLCLPYPRRLLTANAKLPVEVSNVMHR